MGQQVRVAAIDPETGVEVIIVAPATATETQMKSIALAKLKRKLEQEGY
ncbi:serine hydroxymethyltransferase [Pelagibacterium halotolerans]